MRASIETAFAPIAHNWKATIEYHKTKDALHVKELRDHKKPDTTSMYIQIAENLFQREPDAFTFNVARTQEEMTARLKVGFEWIGKISWSILGSQVTLSRKS
jgi:hypothetical protein